MYFRSSFHYPQKSGFSSLWTATSPCSPDFTSTSQSSQINMGACFNKIEWELCITPVIGHLASLVIEKLYRELCSDYLWTCCFHVQSLTLCAVMWEFWLTMLTMTMDASILLCCLTNGTLSASIGCISSLRLPTPEDNRTHHQSLNP